MAEQGYDLMHKDDIVASLQLDDLSGAILKVAPGANPELLPLGGSQGADSLRKWWLRRAVPISQGNIAVLLQQEGIPSTQSLLVRNLGLSLSDHYWIKPNGSELTWKRRQPVLQQFPRPAGIHADTASLRRSFGKHTDANIFAQRIAAGRPH